MALPTPSLNNSYTSFVGRDDREPDMPQNQFYEPAFRGYNDGGYM